MMSTVGAEDAGKSSPTAKPDANKLWIHCNRCFDQFALKRHMFFLLACQHVSCEKCVKACLGRTPSDAPIYTCPICHKNVRGRQINNSMPNNLKRLFHPEPWNLALDFVETFQRTNQKHFNKYKEKKEKIMDKLDKDIELAQLVCQKHFHEQQTLRVERRKLTLRMRQIKLQVAKQKEAERRFLMSKRRRSMEEHTGPASVLAIDPLDSRAPTCFRNRMPPPQSAAAENRRQQITSFAHESNNSFDL
ncbi:RING finger protein vilya isoform X1 [Drosophila miranda]|uniref:RING finger protein vilya isoform X1 n=1 Tax=Drosophila miranda TaxID=7229 RepID=UPI0007E72465|nr:RING finger protein vilya isoform X1 [Drosophila miranda]